MFMAYIERYFATENRTIAGYIALRYRFPIHIEWVATFSNTFGFFEWG